VLQFASSSFDASVGEIFCAFAAGATLVLRDDACLDSPEDFLRACAEWRITFMDLPTAFWHELAALEEIPLPSTLRLLLIGGERALPSRLALWQEGVRGAVRIVNGYGPTEATVAVAFSDLTRWRAAPGLDVPIGRALDGCELYVLDRFLEPVASGAPGELCAGGRGLARGYLDRPGPTAERFVPHPFGAGPGERLYRTGDRVRFRADGELEHLGRLDQQVKVRGFRIEPGEIEAALAASPGVREAAVVVREEPAGEVRLIACVAAAGEPPAPAELRAFLGERLPRHMMPAGWVFLPALPRTPSGKIDRKALARLRPGAAQLSDASAAPRNRAERVLSGIWTRILGVDAVGVHDDFFELGGDSLLSIQVVAAAREEGLELKPREIFVHRTVAALAAVAAITAVARPRAAAAPAPEEPTGEAPLTPVQHWFFDFELGDRNHWNTAALLQPAVPLEARLAALSVECLLRRHDALRCRFSPGPDGWRQRLAAPGGPLPWSEIDLSSLPVELRATALAAAVAQAQTSLRLRDGPVLRACLLQLDAGSGTGQRLLLLAHHLVSDAVSLQILAEDLETAYRQLAGGAPVQLPRKTTPFSDWARRLGRYADSAAIRREAGYWLEQPWAEAHRTPVDFPAGENTRASARTLTRELEPADTDRLLRFAAARRLEMADLVLAALASGVAAWAGHSPVLIGIVRHGREEILPEVDLTRSVGWFNSIFPVLLNVPPDAAPGELAERVAGHMRRLPRGGIGYGLLRFVSTDPVLSARMRRIPRHEISLNYLGRLSRPGAPDALLRTAPEPCGQHHSPEGVRQSLIMLSAATEDRRLRLGWAFSREKHRPETLGSVAAAVEGWLRKLV
jgi:non-ribosomal peptide synthase protein (TIGR01720 family)